MTEISNVPLVQAAGVLPSIVESKKVTPTNQSDTTDTQSILGNETLTTSFSETSSANSDLARFWGSYTGGLSGMAASTSGTVGQGFTSSTNDSLTAYGSPGPNAMSSVLDIAVSKMDNVIEVAGSGMGGDKKYKMFTSELIAVYAALKEKDSQKPEELQAKLKEKYGIDSEIKDIDGKKTLVNKATGNILISDANGNNLMDKSDMKFKEALNSAGLDEDLKWLAGGEFYQTPNYKYSVTQVNGGQKTEKTGTTAQGGVDDSGLSYETKTAVEKLLIEKNGGKSSIDLTQQALAKTQAGATAEEAVQSVLASAGTPSITAQAPSLFARAYTYAA
ncbi:MAG: hypothetical protein V2A78_07330 [bacterium]